jgi:NADH-ubiquinone oxidoreductase chain 5
MIFAAGLSAYSTRIFHLVNHAFFKALLFLGAGCVIHAIADNQDMRRMGGLINMLPLVYSSMLIGSLALIGFPFLRGFYSKDFILEIAGRKFRINGEFVY